MLDSLLAAVFGFFIAANNPLPEFKQEARYLQGETNGINEEVLGEATRAAFIFKDSFKTQVYIVPSPSPVLKIKIAPEQIDSLFSKYASDYGLDEGLLRKIASCESSYNTHAVNGPYGGMYQFTVGSWTTARNLMGLDSNPELRFNAEESIKTAAFKISVHGTGAWPSCSY